MYLAFKSPPLLALISLLPTIITFHLLTIATKYGTETTASCSTNAVVYLTETAMCNGVPPLILPEQFRWGMTLLA